MKLKHVHVSNFKSISDTFMHDVEDLNVLIGRNNSGKSNILSCVQIYFAAIHQGEVIVNLGRNEGKGLFHNHDDSHHIDISLYLALSLSERDELIGNITSEFPEMKNAVEGIRTDFLLRANIRHSKHSLRKEEIVSWVQCLALVDPSDITNLSRGRQIMSINASSAEELQGIRDEINSLKGKVSAVDKFLKRFGSTEYSMLRRKEMPARIEFFLDDAGFDLDSKKFGSLISESSGYEEFSSNLKSLYSQNLHAAEELENKQLNNRISTITGEVTRVPQYALSLIKKISSLKVLLLKENRKQIGAEEARKLLELKVSRGGPETLLRIQETVQTLLGVKLDAFAKSGPGRWVPGEGAAELDVDNFLVEANGAGIREALRIVLDFEFGHPDILLIEEPEIHLHPALERSMLRYLRSVAETCQVFLTTHSTNFLDWSNIKNVYLISKTNGTKCRLLTREDIEEHVPRELGIRLSSLFLYDKLVFVEGKSDEDILQEFASRLGLNLSNANAGFIAMGGARNFAHYATEGTLEFLRKRQVRCFFIIDRDERCDADIDKMIKRIGDNTKLDVLERREIENYLIIPEALGAYLRDRVIKSGIKGEFDYSPTFLETEISKTADELKALAIQKRVLSSACMPIYADLSSFRDQGGDFIEKVLAEFDRRIESLSSKKEGMRKYIQEVQAQMEKEWDKHKLDIVPGEELLTRLFQKYGLRYRKERDGAGIAANTSEKYIPVEIKRIIEAIVANES